MSMIRPQIVLLKLLTFRRSPLEQYSIASNGRSFKAMCFISSGTSLAVTTLRWLILNVGEVKEGNEIALNSQVNRTRGNDCLPNQIVQKHTFS